MTSKVHTILLKTSLSNNIDGYKKLQYMLIWLKNKKLEVSTKPNPIKHENAAYYLIRHLWNNLIENIYDLSYSSRPNLLIPYWNNIVYLVFFTQEIVSCAHMSKIKQATNAEFENQNVCSFGNYFFQLRTEEDFPYNFKQIYRENAWVDWRLVENLFKILEPLWAESLFSITGAAIEQTETQKLDKKISNLLDISNSEDYHKDLEIFLSEPYNNIDPKRGNFLKNVTLLLIAYIEDCVKNSKIELLKVALQRLGRVIKFAIVVSENSRDNNFRPETQDAIISTFVYTFNFLYNIIGVAVNDICKDELKGLLRNITIFLFSVIDFLNTRYGTFNNLAEGKPLLPSSSTSLQTNYNLIIFEMFKSYLNINGESLISSNLIKTLKARDYKDIDTIIYSQEWMWAFLDNSRVISLIEKYYGESFMSSNANALKYIYKLGQSQTQNKIANNRMREEISKKYKTEIYNSADKIHEAEGHKREEIMAFEEENMRISKNFWKKIWKKMRVYIGIWRNPDFYDQIDKKFSLDSDNFEKMVENNIFFHKISKYEIKNRARPFLKVKLLEPKYATDYNNILKSKRANNINFIHSLNNALCFNFKNQTKENKQFNILTLGKSLRSTFKVDFIINLINLLLRQ